MADIEEERAQLAREREQSAEMMRELIALREQLTKQGGENENPAEQEQNGEAEESVEQTSEDTAEIGSNEHTKKV